jgi:ribosome-associated protein
MDSLSKVKKIVNILDDMKGENIIVYNISEVSSFSDFMVICTGNSDTHIMAMADNLHYKMKDLGVPDAFQDGKKGSRWICMDFGDVIVHIMGESEREFYSLESIWGECEDIFKNLID